MTRLFRADRPGSEVAWAIWAVLLVAGCDSKVPCDTCTDTDADTDAEVAGSDSDSDTLPGPSDTDPVNDTSDTDQAGDTDSQSGSDTDVVAGPDTDTGGADTDTDAHVIGGDTNDTDSAVDTGPVLTPGTFPAGAYRLTLRPLDAFSVNLFADGTWMLWYNERFSGTIGPFTEWGCYAQGTYTAGTDPQGGWHLQVSGPTTGDVEVVVGPGDVWTQGGVAQDIEACAVGSGYCAPMLNGTWVWPTSNYHTCTGSFLGVLP